MKKLLPLILLIPIVFSQTEINYNPAHYFVGNIYTNRTVEEVKFSIGSTGGPQKWDFTTFPDGDESDFEVVEYSSSLPEVASCAMTPNYVIYNHTITLLKPYI
ncbi:MAG: hypothetical protein ACLFSQ_03230 [Candidatus Zixiibacteriota bacterium]